MPVLSALSLGLAFAIATPAAAQVFPGQPYIGDPLAAQQRYHMEMQRLQSAEQAAFARQHRLDARLTQLEIQSQRRPEPYIPLVPTVPRSPEAERQAREQATTLREATAAGVGQIDDWLARPPR